MNRYLRDFTQAFKKISVDNYRWAARNSSDSRYAQEAENNFSCELRRHFLNLAELPRNCERYSGLHCHFDVNKELRSIRPDLVLHAAPDNQEKQEIFAEVKVNSNSRLSEDLKKLKRAISTELNFNYAVMVVVNKHLDPTTLAIRNFIRKNQLVENDLKKLYLFHAVRNDDQSTATYTIKSFLELNNG